MTGSKSEILPFIGKVLYCGRVWIRVVFYCFGESKNIVLLRGEWVGIGNFGGLREAIV